MHYKLYEGGILVPVKCGTRYLTHNNITEIDTISIHKIGNKFRIPNLKWIIVRNPLDGFVSALHTDILHIVNGIEPKESSEEWDEELIGKVTDLMRKYAQWNNEEGHFHRNTYRELYWFWRRNYTSDVKIIDLSELNSYSEELGLYQPYDSEDYRFKWMDIWADKESIALWVKNTFAENYKSHLNHILNNDIDGEMKMYNHLLNGDKLPIKIL